MQTIDTIALRKAITAFIREKHPRVYHGAAPKDAAHPYIVFDFPNSFQDDLQEIFVLDIDGWDSAADVTALETVMQAVDGDGDPMDPSGLNRRTLYVGAGAVRVYRTARLQIDDPDERIKRRKYTYQVKTY